MKSKLDVISYDQLNTKLIKLQNDLEGFMTKIEIRLDVAEKKIKEIENALSNVEDDYYSIKKDIDKKVKEVYPYLKDVVELKQFKEQIFDDLESIKKALLKLTYVVSNLNDRLNIIESELHIK